MNRGIQMTTKQLKHQSAGAATGLSMVGAVATMVANFGIAAIAARESLAFAGVFFSVTALVSIVGNGSSLGAQTGFVFFAPKGMDEDGNATNMRPILDVAIRPVIVLSVILGLLTFFLAPQIAGLIGDENSGAREAMLRTAAPSIPAWSLLLVMLGVTRSLGSVIPHVLINQVFRPLAQLLSLLAVFLLTDDLLTQGALVGLTWSIPLIASLTIATVTAVKMGVLTSNGEEAVTRKKFWDYTRPRAASVALQGLLERVDQILIAAIAGDVLAGIYGSVTRFITAGNYMVFSITQATSPALRRAIAAKDMIKAQKLIQQIGSWMILATVPYFVLLAFKAEGVASLLDSEVAMGATALTVLAVGMTISPLAGPVDITLLMLGRSKRSLLTTAIAVVIDIVLTFALVPSFELVGAAIAWVTAVTVQNVLNSYFVYSKSGLKSFGKAPLMAALIGAFSYALPSLITKQSITEILAAGSIGTVIFIAITWLFADKIELGSFRDLAKGKALKIKLNS